MTSTASKLLGKRGSLLFRKGLPYTINGHHHAKVTVLAEVVPIDVVLSTKEISMEFTEDSLESFVTQDLASGGEGLPGALCHRLGPRPQGQCPRMPSQRPLEYLAVMSAAMVPGDLPLHGGCGFARRLAAVWADLQSG